MHIDGKTDEDIIRILRSTRTIAMAGASDKPARASNGVLKFLLSAGYSVTGINPGLAGKTIHGAPVVASLAGVNGTVDLLDVFRNSGDALALIREALALPVPPKVIWLQLGVVSKEGQALAEAAGVPVVMDRCPAIEIPRLGL